MDAGYREAALRFLSGLRFHDEQREELSPPTIIPSSPRLKSKQWRIMTIDQRDLPSPILLGWPEKGGEEFTAIHLLSLIPYRRRRRAELEAEEIPFMNLAPSQRTISYRTELVEEKTRQEEGEEEEEEVQIAYDPYSLDDPELRQGKHKTVFALEGHLGSIGPYTRIADLHRNLNEQFRQLHPHLPPSLTLTQIRRVKSVLLEIGISQDLELSTIAKAYVLLEKLILMGMVHKSNRRLVGACCLLLAAKANDSRALRVDQLLHCLADRFQLDGAQVMAAEWEIFVTLHFHLILPNREYLPHLDRIITQLEYVNVQEYVGERMYQQWRRDTS